MASPEAAKSAAEKRPALDDDDEPVMSAKLLRTEHHLVQGKFCPYLDTIDRSVLDFDFEKLCSVMLSNLNIYACLVCGKYFQGRGKKSPAFTHSVHEGHRVFLNLETQKFYCLPDNYEVIDASLNDIIYVLNPTYTRREVNSLQENQKLARAFDGTTYLPGIVGLNNIKQNDYCNVILQALSHIQPLRDYCLLGKYLEVKRPPGDHLILLVRRFGELVKKLWNPRNFKAHVSPHEILQAVVLCSKKRFQFTEQGDPSEFLAWLLNALHLGMNGTKNRSSTIVSRTFQGTVRVFSRKLPPPDLSRREKNILMNQPEYQETITETPFLHLQCDLPPAPLYPDEMRENIIPQVPLFSLLSKFNGVNEKEYKTYKDLTVKRFQLLRLPRYLILVHSGVYFDDDFKVLLKHVPDSRFQRNIFTAKEKNPTIVNFPMTSIDFGELLEPEDRAKHKQTLYDLIVNITHEGPPEAGKGTYRVHILNKGTMKWYELENLHVRDILPQMIVLSETFIQEALYQRYYTPQIYERQPPDSEIMPPPPPPPPGGVPTTIPSSATVHAVDDE